MVGRPHGAGEGASSGHRRDWLRLGVLQDPAREETRSAIPVLLLPQAG